MLARALTLILTRPAQVLRRMALVPEAEADELEALGERVAVAAAAGVEADAEMGEVPDEFTVRGTAAQQVRRRMI